MDPFDLSQRESQAGHSRAGQPVQEDDDSICGGASLPVPPAIPFPGDNGTAGELLALVGPVCPPAFQPPRAGGRVLSFNPA